MLSLAFCNSLPLLLLGGIFQGIGYGTGYTTFNTMVARDVEPERRGRAMATFYVGFDSGMGLGAFCAGMLSGAIGFSGMYLSYAFLPLIALGIMFVAQRVLKGNKQG